MKLKMFSTDLINAARFLRRNRAFSLAGIATLALGIGATTSLFSVAHAVLFQKLPVASPDELVLLRYAVPSGVRVGVMTGYGDQTPEGEFTSGSLPYPFYETLQRETDVLDPVMAFSGVGRLFLRIGDRTDRISGQLVSGNFFGGLGLNPEVGRLIAPGDDSGVATPVVVLSHAFWETRFARNPSVIGSTVQINRQPYVVIGVAPAGFQGTLQLGHRPALYAPLSAKQNLHHFGSNTERRDYWWVHVLGRLRPEMTWKTAETSLSAIFQSFAREILEEQNREKDLTTLPPPRILLEEGGRGQSERRLRALSNINTISVLVGLVLILSCVNLAALLISKSISRRRELAVKLSLGASRWRLLRELSAEVLWLALPAAAIGLLLALWSMELMTRLVGQELTLETSISWPVAGFAIGTSILTGLTVGVFTALKASGLDPAPALKESDTKVTLTRSTLWWGRGLIGVQVGLGVVLLITTGLFLGTLRNLMEVNVGFESDRLLVFDIEPVGTTSPEDALALYERLHGELAQLPSVHQISYSSQRLIDDSSSSFNFLVAGEPSNSSIDMHYVGPRFLSTMGIPVLAGREIEPEFTPHCPMPWPPA